jgi:hypothetical protein
VTALQLTAVPASIQEGGTRQLLEKKVLDDSSVLHWFSFIGFSLLFGDALDLTGAGSL